MNELGIALLWCALQVTVVGLMTVVLYTVMRRLAPSSGSLVTLTSLMLVVALSAMAFSPWPRWTLKSATVTQRSEPLPLQSSATNVPGKKASPVLESAVRPLDDSDRSSELGEPSSAGLFWRAFIDELRQTPTEKSQGRWHWSAFLSLAFLIGSGLGLLRFLGGLVAVKSHRMRSRTVSDSGLMELVDVVRAKLRCRRPIPSPRRSAMSTTPRNRPSDPTPVSYAGIVSNLRTWRSGDPAPYSRAGWSTQTDGALLGW